MKELRWPEEAGHGWDVVCQVYDLPKLRVPQRILEKRKGLTEKEREYIQAQAAWAAECLASVPGLSGTARVVEDFQERFDGTGRPRGAKGQAIGAQARLLGVADSFVALLSERPYRAAYPEAQAMDLIRADSGKRFDPEIVLALSKVRGL
jgi:HD-GYP domain-containing protein (c-di-GMP phosphodiesterase class II)